VWVFLGLVLALAALELVISTGVVVVVVMAGSIGALVEGCIGFEGFEESVSYTVSYKQPWYYALIGYL